MSQRYIESKERLARRGLLVLAERAAATWFVSLAELLHARHTVAAAARRHFWNLVRDTLGLSYPAIGRLTGHDHTTVLVGIRKRQCELAREYAR